MRNIDAIVDTIYNWNGTFDELAKQFTTEEYEILYEQALWEYVDPEWVEENCYNTGNYTDMLYNFIGDCLMSCIADGSTGKITSNLFRMWN